MKREIIDMDPVTYTEAIEKPDRQEWMHTMEKEMASLHKNQTWEIVKKPKNWKFIGSK